MGEEQTAGDNQMVLDNNLKRKLEIYIKLNYVASVEEDFLCPDINEEEITKSSGKKFEQQKQDLSALVQEAGESFHEMLFRLIEENNQKESDIYKNAGIDRKLFSKIRNNPAYHPEKNTIIALCIALKLDIDNAIEFLESAGYALSPGDRGDIIIKYFIEKKIFDIDTINCALYDFGEKTIERYAEWIKILIASDTK